MKKFCFLFLIINSCASREQVVFRQEPVKALRPLQKPSRPSKKPPRTDWTKGPLALEVYASYPEVQRWVGKFTGPQRNSFKVYLQRARKYRPLIMPVLKEQNLPKELFFHAMVESGFSTHARSHKSAVGPWQFLRGTAREYGLKVGRGIDERRDPVRSTQAAAKYLKFLYKKFYSSWFLALAAYNTGPGRLQRRIRRCNIQGFENKLGKYWLLNKRKAVPWETRNHIPKMLAAMMIARNPEKYGFHVSASPLHKVRGELVHMPISIVNVRQSLALSSSEFRLYNPHISTLKRRRGSYVVWVPVSHPLPELGAVRYVVRRGDTLGKIAERFGVPVSKLRGLNSLKGSTIFPGQNLKLRSARAGVHIVRKNENLRQIARKYKTSARVLLALNVGVKARSLRIGQRLKLPAPSRVYRVRKGDTLSSISRQFKSTPKVLIALNNLKSDKIRRGRHLLVPSKG